MAGQRESLERRLAGPDREAAIRGFLDLIDLYDQLHGWPPTESEARRSDAVQARENWIRVRNHYRRHG